MNKRYSVTILDKTNNLRLVTETFSSKAAALKAAPALAARDNKGAARVSTPAGNLVKYVYAEGVKADTVGAWSSPTHGLTL